MTRESRHSPVGQRRVAALFTSGAVTRVSAAFARLFNFLRPKPTPLDLWWNEREHNFSLRKQARAQGQTFVCAHARKKAGR
jgi:hypothetical protein